MLIAFDFALTFFIRQNPGVSPVIVWAIPVGVPMWLVRRAGAWWFYT